MLQRLNHVAIATADLEKAAALYRGLLGASVSAPQDQPEHGVTTIFVDLPGARLELLAPLGEHSPIANFLKRHPDGGVHHLCFEVADIITAAAHLKGEGARVLGGVKTGAHGKPVLFLHPKDCGGTLIELEQA